MLGTIRDDAQAHSDCHAYTNRRRLNSPALSYHSPSCARLACIPSSSRMPCRAIGRTACARLHLPPGDDDAVLSARVLVCGGPVDVLPEARDDERAVRLDEHVVRPAEQPARRRRERRVEAVRGAREAERRHDEERSVDERQHAEQPVPWH
eukprot:6060986-Pleurochrysis_carterae.AAC.2